MTLHIDIETYSSVDLKKAGVYKYVESPDFEVLIIAYKFDGLTPVHVIDIGEINSAGPDADDLDSLRYLLGDLEDLLYDPKVTKKAFNATFEITCLSKFFDRPLDPAQWSCTQVRGAMLGLPFQLDQVGAVLNLPVKKDPKGKALIKYFSVPCKPTIVNGGRTRNLPSHDPVKWAEFVDYCRTDVLAETAIDNKISFFTPAEFERPFYQLDNLINRRGMKIDRELVNWAISINEIYSKRLTSEAVKITGLTNPGSVAKLKSWLELEIGEEIPNLQKKNLPALINEVGPGEVARVLEIRQQLSKSSIKKYTSMIQTAGADDRIRGLFQYYGANRTGRFAGRLVQVQNLVKNNLEDLDLARRLVREGDLETIELVFGNVSRVLSQLVRTAFVPALGCKFYITDFSAIEARVLAWLAGETWRLEVFKTHGKIYEAAGARMFKKHIDEIKKGSPERDASKIAELALGYQGSWRAIMAMIAQEEIKSIEAGKAWTFHPTEDEAKDIVDKWRAVNRKIVEYWYDINDAAKLAVANPRGMVTHGLVKYQVERGVLFCTLPSGRRLSYMRPKLVEGLYGPQIEYEGLNQTSKKWEKTRLYGGLLVENITQAVARDLLAVKLLDIHEAGFDIVGHVHDEIICEVDLNHPTEAIDFIMGQAVEWAPGLPLKGEGFESMYYKKDD